MEPEYGFARDNGTQTKTHGVDLQRLTGVATSRLKSLSTTRVGVEVDARVSRRRGRCKDSQIPIIVPTGKGDHSELGSITGVPEADDGRARVSTYLHTHPNRRLSDKKPGRSTDQNGRRRRHLPVKVAWFLLGSDNWFGRAGASSVGG